MVHRIGTSGSIYLQTSFSEVKCRKENKSKSRHDILKAIFTRNGGVLSKPD